MRAEICSRLLLTQPSRWFYVSPSDVRYISLLGVACFVYFFANHLRQRRSRQSGVRYCGASVLFPPLLRKSVDYGTPEGG